VGALTIAALAFALPNSVTGNDRTLLLLCLLPLAQVGDVAEWRLIAGGKATTVAGISLLVFPAAALLRIWLAVGGFSATYFAGVLVLEWSARSAIVAIASQRLDSEGRPGLPSRRALEIASEAMPLLLAGMAVFLYMRLDQFMIGAFLDAHSVGLYSAVVTISEAPLVLPAILLKTSLPLLTSLAQNDPLRYAAYFEGLCRKVFYLHLTGAAVLWIAAEPIILLLYGNQYSEAVEPFRVTVLASPFIALGVISSAWLVISRNTAHALRRTALGLIVNVALNFVLIPRMGVVGASVATLAAQVVATFLSDALFPSTRFLFRMKCKAILPLSAGNSR
jgi:O-antigen/teichoic acid export membrane protein